MIVKKTPPGFVMNPGGLLTCGSQGLKPPKEQAREPGYRKHKARGGEESFFLLGPWLFEPLLQTFDGSFEQITCSQKLMK